MVPEVSLILDKPHQTLNMNDSPLHATPESRIYSGPNATPKGSQSYAAWREKQFPQQLNKTSPINYNKNYTPRNSSLQDNYDSRKPVKSYSSLDSSNYNHKNRTSHNDSTKKYKDPKRHSDNYTNKYTLSHTRSCNEIDRLNNSYNYKTRSHNDDERRNERRDERRDERQHERQDARQDARQDERQDDKRVYRRDENKDEEKDHTKDEERDKIYDDRRNFNDSYSDEFRVISDKPKVRRSSSHSNIDYYTHRSMPMEYDYQSKHSRLLQPIHCSPEHSHNCSGCCNFNHSKSHRDTETVKNLLQVITSQNEQIKSLQKQLERLLKLHEQNLKDRNQCTCQSNGIVYQNTQLYDQSRTANLPVAHNNLIQDNERCFSDVKLQNEKTKQTILEQKVSIGVMTSFELKVQNNPSLGIDNDMKQKNSQEKVVSSLETSNMIKNLVNDTGEMIRKKQNIFTPTPLENISEASESHISSLRQSHLCSDSMRPLVMQDAIDITNANYCNQNCQETNNVQRKAEPRRCVTESNDKNIRHTNNIDYEDKEPRYRDARDNIEERRYQYNFQYEDLHSLANDNFNEKKTDDFNAEPILNDIIKTKSTKFDNIADDCLSLSSSELDLDDPSPPSPEPSIHVDLQEYSSENGSLPPQRSTKVGWTLYNNVVDQVNQILQNSPLNESSDEEISDDMRKNDKKEIDNNMIMDTVKAATLEQLTKLGISFSDNVEQREPNSNKKYFSFYSN
jgi:hypothetical protein